MSLIAPLELINRAYRLAVGIGGDTETSPIVDNIWAFEEAFPIALRRAAVETSRSADEVPDYVRQHTLTVTDGVADIPETVLTEFLDSSSLFSGDDETIAELASYAPRWNDFQRPVHDMLHYYTEREGRLYFREAGGELFTWDGELELVCVSMPPVPAAIATMFEVPDSMADRVVQILADMIRGRSDA